MHEKQPLAVEEAFTLLDIERKGMISSLADIDRFLRNNGKVASKDELVRIFRVLSFDRDPSVLYETFQEHLDPLGKGYYIGYS
jgi:Ca2+-binding EF-hand superfamily protein